MKKLLLIISLATMFFACDKSGSKDVVGKVDGEKIYFKKDVEPTLNFFKYISAMQGKKIAGQDSINMVKDIIKQVAINKIILKTTANNIDYNVPDSVVEAKVNNVLKNNFKGNDSLFEVALKKQNTTLKDYKRSIREGEIIKKYMDNIKANIKLDSATIADYFDKNMKKIEKKYKVSHILILERSNDSAKLAKAKAKIDSIYGLVKKGEDFAKLAQKYSQGPSAKNGGDIGWVSPKNLDPNFSNAMLKLKDNEVSGVVKSSFGYHIIKMFGNKMDTTKLTPMAYKKVEEQLQNRDIQKEIDKIAEGHKIEYFVDAKLEK